MVFPSFHAARHLIDGCAEPSQLIIILRQPTKPFHLDFQAERHLVHGSEHAAVMCLAVFKGPEFEERRSASGRAGEKPCMDRAPMTKGALSIHGPA